MVQLSASPTRSANSTARSLMTGSVPGMPAQISHATLLGGAEVESTTAQPQNILE